MDLTVDEEENGNRITINGGFSFGSRRNLDP